MPFLGLFIAVVCLFTFFRKRSNRSQENVTDRFWKRESIANNTRLQDLSGLPYITIPFDKFPIGMYENDLLKNYENSLQTLSGQKIVNFGTQTNTDLKITYGTASLPALTEYEQNFTTLCQTLTAYAGQLFELGHTDDARTILEYGISIGSDLSQNYLLLAKIYQSSGENGRIRELLASAEQLDSLMKRSIVEKLTAMLPEDTANTPVQ